VNDGKAVLLPFFADSRGHYALFQATAWQSHLAAFLMILDK